MRLIRRRRGRRPQRRVTVLSVSPPGKPGGLWQALNGVGSPLAHLDRKPSLIERPSRTDSGGPGGPSTAGPARCSWGAWGDPAVLPRWGYEGLRAGANGPRPPAQPAVDPTHPPPIAQQPAIAQQPVTGRTSPSNRAIAQQPVTGWTSPSNRSPDGRDSVACASKGGFATPLGFLSAGNPAAGNPARDRDGLWIKREACGGSVTAFDLECYLVDPISMDHSNSGALRG